MGFPIWSLNGGAGLEHWTLLVIKQIAGGGKILRYYDSSRSESPFNRSVAEMVCTVLGESGCPPRCNSMRFQVDGVACGLWCGYFWELEVREHLGFGSGGLPWPAPQVISSRRERLQRVVQGCRSGHAIQKQIEEQKMKKNAKQKQMQEGVIKAQVAGVKSPLGSVMHMIKSGNTLVFGRQ